ncbi:MULTISPECIES: alpha/beta hydrolase [unclassified Janibacter]|uniref:alpha/beta hydrolase n=1 Tax=unclassified Janibacter TaxID=2649294 RepID=UPI003CFBF32E
MGVAPGAEPFAHDGGDVGVLVVHGFSGSPKSMRPWAEHLAAQGYTVRLPRLPGHGTTWQEMNRTTWHDWYGEVEREFLALRATCRKVVVVGLSMGGALATRLAQQHHDDVAGLVLVNPAIKVEDVRLKALPLLKRLVPSLPGIGNDIKKPGQDEGAYDRVPLRALHSQTQLWDTVIRDLPAVSQPVLLLRSAVDNVVPASSSALLLSRISSTDVTEIVLEDSYHVATIDNDAPVIFDESAAFIDRVTA